MATIVCPSYLESQLVEPRIHRLRILPSPKPLTPPQPIDLTFKWDSNTKPLTYNAYKIDSTTQQQHHNNNKSSNLQQGGWTSIQTLSSNNASEESTYVKSYSSVRLSAKSLELCTENLGNETGSDMIESESATNDFFTSSETTTPTPTTRRDQEKRKTLNKVSGAKEFPPPLTTIRGTESLRVSSIREGGRLLLQVTKVNVPSSFHAQRSHGRLRLSLATPSQHHHNSHLHHRHIQAFEDQELIETQKTNGHVEDKNKDKEEEEMGEWNVGVKNDESARGRSRISRSRCKECEHENKNDELFIKKWGEHLWVSTS